MKQIAIKYLIGFSLFFIQGICCFAQKEEIIKLWPGAVPGEKEAKHPAELYKDTSRGVKRITNITDPMVTVYRPAEDNNNGVGVIVCPGGGYKYLAINIEGEEIAKWFTQQGFTAFVLQYRVPAKKEGALQDIQRAFRLIRSKTAELKLNMHKLGGIGFSAGGNLVALAACSTGEETYTKIDRADSFSARPDFALLIYAAYLSEGPDRHLSSKLLVDKNTPPIFLFGTNDDPVGLPLALGDALNSNKVYMELHVYPKGGHGYGMRLGNPAAQAWPLLAGNWLHQFVENKKTE